MELIFRQCVRQIRVENTFAFIDGGSNYYMSSSICLFLTQFLRENVRFGTSVISKYHFSFRSPQTSDPFFFDVTVNSEKKESD